MGFIGTTERMKKREVVLFIGTTERVESEAVPSGSSGSPVVCRLRVTDGVPNFA